MSSILLYMLKHSHSSVQISNQKSVKFWVFYKKIFIDWYVLIVQEICFFNACSICKQHKCRSECASPYCQKRHFCSYCRKKSMVPTMFNQNYTFKTLRSSGWISCFHTITLYMYMTLCDKITSYFVYVHVARSAKWNHCSLNGVTVFCRVSEFVIRF